MSSGAGRRRSRGQAITEFSVALPVLTLLALGGIDLGRGFYLGVETNGATRTGVRAAIQGDTFDIGDYVRSEPNTAIPNTTTAWGATGPGASNANCTSAPASQSCGDPQGCVASSFTGSQVACFAIRTCTLSGSSGDTGTFNCSGAWGSRPVPGATAHAIQVRVVYRLAAVTPLIQQFFSGALLIGNDGYGDEIYF